MAVSAITAVVGIAGTMMAQSQAKSSAKKQEASMAALAQQMQQKKEPATTMPDSGSEEAAKRTKMAQMLAQRGRQSTVLSQGDEGTVG